MASTPPPPAPPPPPPPPAAVSIFVNPTPTTYTSVGASAKASDIFNLSAPLGPISTAPADQPQIRYTGNGAYEVQLPGGTWERLTLYGQGTAGTALTNGTTSGGLLMSISGSKDNGYQYSELASYRSGGPDLIGAFAFGTLTPAGSVPVSGSATYSGIVAGKTDVIASDPFDGPNRAWVSGSVNLDFNFGTGSLSGAMTIGLNDAAMGPLSIGTFTFKDTVFSVGSTSYSGKFTTSAAGENFFMGKFTGPNAQETIGAWALPFVLDVGNSTITADHKTHQAFGAWIAKNH